MSAEEGFGGVDLIDDALEWAVGEQKTAEDVARARRCLYLILSQNAAEWENTSRMRRAGFILPRNPGVKLPRDCDDVLVITTATRGSDSYTPVNRRLNPAEYAGIANKTQDGAPSSFYLERSEPPVLYLHGTGAGRHCVVWYYRKPATFSLDSNGLDAPDRWFRTLSLQVARDVVGKTHPVDEGKFERLAGMAADAEERARRADRNRTPFRVGLAHR